MGKVCAICGKNSGYYPLCKEHLEMKSNGLVQKNEEGQWCEINTKSELHKQEQQNTEELDNSVCVVCGAHTSYGYLFCKDCYKYRIKKVRENFDHNRKYDKLKEHYFQLRKLTETILDKEEIIDNCCLLFALAEEIESIYDDTYFREKVEKDILNLLKNYDNNKHKQKELSEFNDTDYRKKWPADCQCNDGHYVRSKSEMLIDNWLYENNYVHAYEKSVYMDTEPNAIVLSDFYLPKADLYIEFWGIEDDENYKKRKEYKMKLYEDNGYKRLDLYPSDINRLNDIMPRALAKYIKKK